MLSKYRKLANQIDSILHMSVSMTAQDQMLEIVFKDSMPSQDLPENTVSTEYHDRLMAAWQQDTVELNKDHAAQIVKLKEEIARVVRMRKSSIENSNEQFDLREKAESALLDAQIELNELTALLDEQTKPKTTTITAASDHRHEATDPQPKEIKHIAQNAMVKGLAYETKEEAEQADALFDKVRMTKFYTDKELQTIEKMPKFSGHSLIKGKWIYIKQPPLNQLAADEEPFLNLRPKRPAHGSLNKNEVWQLRRYLRSGRRNIWIEERMGLSSAAVSQARTGKTYQNVPEEPKRVKKTTTVHAGEGVIDCGHPLN